MASHLLFPFKEEKKIYTVGLSRRFTPVYFLVPLTHPHTVAKDLSCCRSHAVVTVSGKAGEDLVKTHKFRPDLPSGPQPAVYCVTSRGRGVETGLPRTLLLNGPQGPGAPHCRGFLLLRPDTNRRPSEVEQV